MADVFLSYASSDLGRAKVLAEALESKGLSVWWDRQIPIGKSFPKVIETELNVAKCVVVLWSSVSIESEWVLSEAGEGAERKILVPIRIDDSKIPLEFRRLQTADMSEWPPRPEQLVASIAAISALVELADASVRPGVVAASGRSAVSPSKVNPSRVTAGTRRPTIWSNLWSKISTIDESVLWLGLLLVVIMLPSLPDRDMTDQKKVQASSVTSTHGNVKTPTGSAVIPAEPHVALTTTADSATKNMTLRCHYGEFVFHRPSDKDMPLSGRVTIVGTVKATCPIAKITLSYGCRSDEGISWRPISAARRLSLPSDGSDLEAVFHWNSDAVPRTQPNCQFKAIVSYENGPSVDSVLKFY